MPENTLFEWNEFVFSRLFVSFFGNEKMKSLAGFRRTKSEIQIIDNQVNSRNSI